MVAMEVKERNVHAKNLVVGKRYAYRYDRGGVHCGHCIVEHVQDQPFWKRKPLTVTFKPEFAKRLTMRAENVEFFEQETLYERRT